MGAVLGVVEGLGEADGAEGGQGADDAAADDEVPLSAESEACEELAEVDGEKCLKRGALAGRWPLVGVWRVGLDGEGPALLEAMETPTVALLGSLSAAGPMRGQNRRTFVGREGRVERALIRPALRGPAIFTGVYMSASIVYAVSTGNSEFLFYWLVMLALTALVWAVDRRLTLSVLVLWLLAIWGLLHMIGGNVPIPERLTEPGEQSVLYSLRLGPWIPKYDQIVHAFGFFTTTLVAWRAMNALTEDRLRPTAGVLFGAMMISMGLSAMNEIIEFAATLLFDNTNVGGYENTGWDLVSNITGCVIAAGTLRVMERERLREGP